MGGGVITVLGLRDASMLTPEDFNPENSRICWPAIFAVFAVQMIVLITISIAVAHHSDFATASSQAFKAGLGVDDKSDVPKVPATRVPAARVPARSNSIPLVIPN
jgi:hypothetical protein